jgi:hypothetical protein
MSLVGKHLPKYTINLLSRICEQSEPILSHSLINYFSKLRILIINFKE